MTAKNLRISLVLSVAAMAAVLAVPHTYANVLDGVTKDNAAQKLQDARVKADSLTRISDDASATSQKISEAEATSEFASDVVLPKKSFGASSSAYSSANVLSAKKAADDAKSYASNLDATICNVGSNSTGTCVKVSEQIPGVSCVKISTDPRAPVYSCPVGKNFSGFFDVLKGLLKYAVVIGVMVGVLMIVVSGIRLSLGSAFGDDGKAAAKEALMKAVGGVASIILLGAILNTVAPWVFK